MFLKVWNIFHSAHVASCWRYCQLEEWEHDHWKSMRVTKHGLLCQTFNHKAYPVPWEFLGSEASVGYNLAWGVCIDLSYPDQLRHVRKDTRWCPSSLAKLVNITPITRTVLVDISIVHGIINQQTSLGGTILYCPDGHGSNRGIFTSSFNQIIDHWPRWRFFPSGKHTKKRWEITSSNR